MVLSWLVVLAVLQMCAGLPETHYHNHFAVHVPAGRSQVDDIARRHGFTNHGQIGSLKGYYLLSHHEVHKRSTEPSHQHHQNLNDEPEVKWFEQQREKRRVKRDYSPYESTLWSQLSRRLPSHRTRHRAITPSPFFTDPLFKEQWYLNGGAKDGLDMNVVPAWQRGYTGKGVVVSILDDGIQTNHPDLVQNYDPLASTDINGNDDDPMPRDNGDNKHGTRCAGEVAAVAYNQYCGVGIAYNASIGGVRMLDGVVNDAVEARALGLNPDHIDIYSASWGPEDDGKTVDGPGPLARRAFIYGVTSGRRGKGSIFVWASGNGGRHTDSCNCDGYTNSIFTLSISSATQGGFKPWYLEECSSTLASTYSSGTPGHDKSVATVDMDGGLRPDHICTVEHTGTSASAPLAAGICALALEANPNLTWRDMQYLVVLSSRSLPLEKETGWIVNGVKRKVSHKFGYGLMDASEMVNLAEQWLSVPPQHICKSQEINEDKAIESSYGYTLKVHMDVNGCSGTVNEVRYLEHVQCKISLRFFPRGNLRILLTSPMGTTSTLLFERPRDVISSNFDDWPFLSVHFWGERAEGRWSLQIVNAGNRHVNQPGILKKWQLIFYGTATEPVRYRSKRPAQAGPAFAYPTAVDSYDGAGDPFYNTDAFNNYQNFPSLFAAGSDPEKAVASLDGHNVPSPHGENVLSDSNDKRVVHDCDPECDSQGCYGKGPTQCIACKHYRLDDACVSRCPPRSFANQGGVCWPCHESCETCVGPGQDSCLTCSPAHLLVADLGLCIQQCPDGYWENSEASVCRPCASHCSTCSERADACTSCEHHLVLYNGTCSTSCPPSTYETQDYSCAKCHESCGTCVGSEENQCITCPTSSYVLDGRCVSACPSGYYADKKRKECMKCPIGCTTCLSTFCQSCSSNWELNKKGRCVAAGSEKCNAGEFSDGGQCHLCHNDCDSCYGQTEGNCLTCPSPNLLQNHKCVSECSRGYYSEAGRCTRCVHGCGDCASRLNCTYCTGALRLQSGTCRTACAEGYYADRGTCSKCYLSCRTCIGPRRDQCASCPRGWRLAAGECHPECPQGFYKTTDGCRHCHHYCRECDGSGPLHCTACPQRFMLDGGLCMECLGSQYFETSSGMCRSCDDSCRMCSGPGQYSCTGCSRPLRLDRLNNQCVQCCSERVGNATTRDCCHCDHDSGECINSSVAVRRIAQWVSLQTDESGPSLSSVMLAGGAVGGLVLLAVGVLLHIGSLKGYYLLSHHEVHKRSTEPSHQHHQNLNDEPEVKWFEQQREKRRVKRDYSPYESTLWSQLSRRLPSHRTRHRAITPSPFFTDPLFKEQWYLNGGAKDGLDMNVVPAWQRGYTGKGVVVSILDDGIQTNHPDLVQNYDPLASTDINGNDDDPMPRDNGDNKHGTRCAGEVAAVAYNQYCGVGIAYNASIGGVRMLDGVVNDAVEARALGLNPDHIDIYSASWGPEDDGKTVDGPGPLARRAFIYGVTSGRRGKGSIFVWASGNGGRHTDSCNCDGYTNSIFTLSISSATQGGFKPWYLEECSSTLASTYSSGTPGHDKSVATVDMDGGLRPDHICTVEHTGTSASAPLAAGICALALEANPNLTWRDMQYLVVLSSRSLPLEKETGWIVNGVKRKVSHKFGYGLMDASEMVNLAEQWLSVPPQHICKSQEINEDKAIESSYGYTLKVHMDVNGCSGTVNEVRYLEHVQCKISLRFFPRGNLRILLTSPMGTTSTLLFERPRDVISSNFDDWPFLSVHFWGERAEGRWSLQIVNAGNRHVNQPGILKKWQLIFYGTATEPVRYRSKRPAQAGPAFAYPTAVDSYDGAGDPFYNTDAFNNYQNFPSLFAAGSDPEKAVASLDGHNVPSPHGENVLSDSNDKRVVHDCDPECDSQGCYGKGPTQCIACKHYRLDDACVSRCPPRSFANQGGVCWPCHESCETCVGPGQDSCLTCSPAHLLVADLGLCIQQCPDGYWENSEASVCRPCASHCSTCSERADACTSCEHHLVLYNGTCSTSCPPSTYETQDYTCAKCHESCGTCVGSEENQCITCPTSSYVLDGRCVSACPSGYYADKKRKECMKCPIGCTTCLSTFCQSCSSNWELNKKGRCVAAGSEKCNAGEFSDGGQCHLCHNDCDSCYGQTEGNCLTCPSPNLLQNHKCVSECSRGYYSEAGRCTRCVHGCGDCASRLNCTYCTGALRLQSGTCRTACAEGYYADRGTCSKCYLSCRTCIGPRRDQCASCPRGWRLAAGECHPECPQGFYKTTDGCRHCHHYCRECDGSGPLHCTACPQRFMLDGGLCMECLGSQYFETSSGMCRSCDDSCRMCSGPGQYSCTGCSRPLRLDRLNNQCVQCCSERVGNATTRDCCHCDHDSGECINSSVAVRRIAQWVSLQTDESGPSLSSVMLAGGAVGGLVLLAVGVLLLKRSRKPQIRSKGLTYAMLDADETDAGETTRDSEHALESDELEHAPLMKHST